MHFRVIKTLDAPRPALFDVLSDPRRRTEWQSSLSRLHVETPGPPRLGTRWREVTRVGAAFDLEITRHEPPGCWAERARGWLADAELLVQLDEVGPQTRLSVDVDIAFRGPFKALAPLVRRLMPGALGADLERLAALARAAA